VINKQTKLRNNNDQPCHPDTEQSQMNSIQKLLGYQYYIWRVVFEHEGAEIVFINDFALGGRVRIYLDGELLHSSWSAVLGYYSDSTISHNGVCYRFIQRTTNCLTMAQEVTLYKDGVEIGRKVDEFWSAFSWKQLLHALMVPFALGGVVGFLVAWLS